MKNRSPWKKESGSLYKEQVDEFGYTYWVKVCDLPRRFMHKSRTLIEAIDWYKKEYLKDVHSTTSSTESKKDFRESN